MLTQALSENSIRAMEEHVLRNIRKFYTKMGAGGQAREGKWSSPKDMTRWAGCLTFDIMGDVCFSYSFEMLDKEENRYILDVLPKGVQAMNVVCELLSHCRGNKLRLMLRQVAHMRTMLNFHLEKLVFAPLASEMRRYMAFSKKQSNTRVERGNNVPIKDVFSFLIDAKDPETGM